MDKKFPAFLKGLAGLAQNTRLNLSLEGWSAVIAVCAIGNTILGIAAYLASSTKAEGGHVPDQGEPPEDDRQDNDDVPAEGSSDEADDPSDMFCFFSKHL